MPDNSVRFRQVSVGDSSAWVISQDYFVRLSFNYLHENLIFNLLLEGSIKFKKFKHNIAKIMPARKKHRDMHAV